MAQGRTRTRRKGQMNAMGTKKWDGTKWVPVNVARDGQRATLGGKPVVRKNGEWVPYRASTRSRNRRSSSGATNTPVSPKTTKTKAPLKDIPASQRPKDMQAGKVYGDAGQPPAPKLPPKPQRSPSRSPSRSPARVPKKAKQSKDMDANYRAWAKANPGLAKKVKKGQAGFNSINNNPVSTKTEEEKKKKKQQMMSGTTRQSINQGLA